MDCQWDEWIIGDCSQTCGNSTKTLTRQFKVASANGGNACDGLSYATEPCFQRDCPGMWYFCVKISEIIFVTVGDFG